MTSIEWFIKEIEKHDKEFSCFYSAEITQFKERHKQEIIDAVNIDKRQYDNAEKYYQETFGRGTDAKDVVLGYKTSLDAQMLDSQLPQQEISEEAKKRAANYMSLKGALESKNSQYVDFSNPNADKITSGTTNKPMETKKQTAVELFIEQLEQKSFQETEGINQIHITIDANEYLTLKDQAKEMHKKEQDNITRLEVIDNQGRQYVQWNCKIELSYQDNGKTLKVFVYPKN